jgi:deoxyribonuclease V
LIVGGRLAGLARARAMRIARLHDWNLSPREAVALQRQLAGRIITTAPVLSCDLIAGADVSYNRRSPVLYAGVVVLRASDLAMVERQGVVQEVSFPYVPGLLSFRETPVVLQAFAKLKQRPDLVMCDGQGFAHPRRFGLACHLGLWLGLPTFGCAKSLLIGKPDELAAEAGSRAPLGAGDEVLGAAVRTKTRGNRVFGCVGHLINLESAVRWTLATTAGYRTPEPTRQAHLFVNEMRQRGNS